MVGRLHQKGTRVSSQSMGERGLIVLLPGGSKTKMAGGGSPYFFDCKPRALAIRWSSRAPRTLLGCPPYYLRTFSGNPGASQATPRDTRAPRPVDRACLGPQRRSARSSRNLWGSGPRVRSLLPPVLRASPLQAMPCCFQFRVPGARSSGSRAPARSRTLRPRSPVAWLHFPLLWPLAAPDSRGSSQVRRGRKVSLAAISAASAVLSRQCSPEGSRSGASDASSPRCGPEPETASLPALFRRPRASDLDPRGPGSAPTATESRLKTRGGQLWWQVSGG
ncbi:hypothetical protein NDU88_002070 [Pleurodeles waltl]|uniref:Uncharacterized protein n=1 Tax=Pleurodeles waltl TaxID=8319 RepID=A0AAV7M2A8_PLEWA|nr:hypothetical protein NDU88_002070 [Pleurodeles waltl]